MAKQYIRDTTITSQNGADTCWLLPRICRASCGVFMLGSYFFSDFLFGNCKHGDHDYSRKQYYYLGEADLELPLRSLQLLLTYITKSCIRVGCPRQGVVLKASGMLCAPSKPFNEVASAVVHLHILCPLSTHVKGQVKFHHVWMYAEGEGVYKRLSIQANQNSN